MHLGWAVDESEWVGSMLKRGGYHQCVCVLPKYPHQFAGYPTLIIR